MDLEMEKEKEKVEVADADNAGIVDDATKLAAPATATSPRPPEAAQPAQTAAPRAPSPAPSTASSTGRPPYVPQFSAATQMILKRINSKPGSLSSALSSASSTFPRNIIKDSAFEDTKRRLVKTMNTSLTMPMPTLPSKQTPSSSTAKKSSAGNTMPLPMNDAFQLRTPAPAKYGSSTKEAPRSQKAPVQKTKGKPQRGTKRKRGKNDDDEDEDEGTSSSLSDLSDIESHTSAAAAANTAKENQATPTMTKSGRQVQKPAQYNPSQQSARDATTQKRKNYGKRTAEQALCKVCTRGLSVPANQIVFCDGCNLCWHQMCHDPYIDDEFVSNESRSWFCGRCMAKREKHLARKKNLDSFKGTSWAGKTNEQKRTYLSGVPHAQLVNIIMYSTELHPDLPIFPPETKRGATQAGRSSHESLRGKTESNINVGPNHYSSKVSTPDSHTVNVKTRVNKGVTGAENQDQIAREDSADSVPPAWPKVGRGCLAGLEINEDDLRDDNDYEAFSVTTYDSKGKKILENGMPI
ncbi:uncharacterized protein F4812DRAFT_407080 [Daldinia caldariorum]|uniref:uncharacterized protein n=1 Tax=Daldinia caldariorum TaxID=326644 RepID=UPI0020088329|nr:uncharacterized protein F4812DRAFT_407080 [Daldinia caldariorum]KAI1467729.1 hypothetical protein F4812DRAFT_407080 [Daldinia caldariorum]